MKESGHVRAGVRRHNFGHERGSHLPFAAHSHGHKEAQDSTNGCDSVVAFGGGSALDVEKAVRLRVKRPTQTLSHFDYDADWSDLVPLFAIPTTAGTGSEVGRSSVIIMGDRKRVIFHPALLASLVILDPESTRELPPKLTAATGADALTYCIESVTSAVFHPLCDGIALEGIRLISDALIRAVKDGDDLEARGLMQVAPAMGGVAFQKDLGATHSLAHPATVTNRGTGTTVTDGVRRVTNQNGLGLGTGPVAVEATPTSELRFSFTSSAGAVSITNVGGTGFAAGATTFRSSANAATASIVNRGSLAHGARGGFTEFHATSRAGSATFQNLGSFFVGGAGGIGGGDMFFYGSSTADAATILNGGGFANSAEGGQTNFFSNSSAGTAKITNFAANAAFGFQGATVFRNLATAGDATILNAGSGIANAAGGVTEFLCFSAPATTGSAAR